MAFKMKKELSSEVDFGETALENVFIKHYLPSADEEQLKVYIIGLFCAKNAIELTVEAMANILDMPESKIKKSLEYWEKLGLLTLTMENGELGANFFSIRSQVFNGKNTLPTGDDLAKALSEMVLHIKKSPITNAEYSFYHKFLENNPHGMEILETVLTLYYKDKKGNQFTEVKAFLEEVLKAGYTDTEQVMIYANNYFSRQNFYKRVKLLISSKPTSTRAEQTMMNEWLDNYKMSEVEIVRFVEKHSPNTNNPTIGFINKQIIDAHSQTKEGKERLALCKKFKLEITGSRYAVNKTEQKIMWAWIDELGLSEEEILKKIEKHSPTKRGATVDYIDQCIRGVAEPKITRKSRSKKRTSQFEDSELEELLNARLKNNKEKAE